MSENAPTRIFQEPRTQVVTRVNGVKISALTAGACVDLLRNLENEIAGYSAIETETKAIPMHIARLKAACKTVGEKLDEVYT